MNIRELTPGDLIYIKDTNIVYFHSLNDPDVRKPNPIKILNKNYFIFVKLIEKGSWSNYSYLDLIVFNQQMLNIYQAQVIEDKIVKIK